MKLNKHQIEQKIQEILSYLLSCNMVDMDKREFTSKANQYHSLIMMYENLGVKAYRTGIYQESIRQIN